MDKNLYGSDLGAVKELAMELVVFHRNNLVGSLNFDQFLRVVEIVQKNRDNKLSMHNGSIADKRLEDIDGMLIEIRDSINKLTATIEEK